MNRSTVNKITALFGGNINHYYDLEMFSLNSFMFLISSSKWNWICKWFFMFFWRKQKIKEFKRKCEKLKTKTDSCYGWAGFEWITDFYFGFSQKQTKDKVSVLELTKLKSIISKTAKWKTIRKYKSSISQVTADPKHKIWNENVSRANASGFQMEFSSFICNVM